MVEENISQEFRLKNIDQKRNHLLEEKEQNELMTKKHKKSKRFCTIVNHIEQFFI